jgi:hypothetical protein
LGDYTSLSLSSDAILTAVTAAVMHQMLGSFRITMREIELKLAPTNGIVVVEWCPVAVVLTASLMNPNWLFLSLHSDCCAYCCAVDMP